MGTFQLGESIGRVEVMRDPAGAGSHLSQHLVNDWHFHRRLLVVLWQLVVESIVHALGVAAERNERVNDGGTISVEHCGDDIGDQKVLRPLGQDVKIGVSRREENATQLINFSSATKGGVRFHKLG